MLTSVLLPSDAFFIKSWKKGNSRHSQSGTEGVNVSSSYLR